MPLNNTEEQVKKSAQKDHAKKLIFEATLLAALKPKFNAILNDFRRTFAITGNFPDISKHNADIQEILEQHYGNVADNFSHNIEDTLGEPTNRTWVRNNTELSVQIHKNIQVPLNAQYIANTNQKQMHEARNEVIIAAALAGLFLTNRQIANQTHARLASKFAQRLPLIAIDNTQNAAEQAKQSEYEALISNEAVAGGIDFATAEALKLWFAILDGVTRPAHAAADGQIVPISQPFIVGGEKLMFPRDTSLGASMGNVANCRCSSVPVIK
jgi:uncharacterized protein with gpF-like domain